MREHHLQAPPPARERRKPLVDSWAKVDSTRAGLLSLQHVKRQPGRACLFSVGVVRSARRVARLEQFLRPASEFFEVREQPAGLIARGLPGAVLHFVLETQDASVATLLAIG